MADGSLPPRDWINIAPPNPNQNTMIAVSPKRLEAIADQVCARHGIGRNDLLSKSRRPAIVHIRWEFMWRARHETCASYPAIGAFLGGMDHTSVLHGVKRYEAIVGLDLSTGGLNSSPTRHSPMPCHIVRYG